MLWYVAILNTLAGTLAITNGTKRDDAKEVLGGCAFLLAGAFAWVEVLS